MISRILRWLHRRRKQVDGLPCPVKGCHLEKPHTVTWKGKTYIVKGSRRS